MPSDLSDSHLESMQETGRLADADLTGANLTGRDMVGLIAGVCG